jgi:hypothetical protein
VGKKGNFLNSDDSGVIWSEELAPAVVGSVVQWKTLSERGTLGFHVLRQDPESGEYRRVNKQLLPGLLYSRLGATYRLLDPAAQPGEIYRYELIEVEAAGETHLRPL